MKKIYMLDNSQGVIRTLVGLKSRITSTKPLLTMLALLMVCLFGVSEKAWAGNVVFNAPASASPTEGGSVSVSPSNQQTVWSAGVPFTSLYSEVEATFTYSASANTTAGYLFKGWSTSSTSNSGDNKSSSFNKKYKQKGKSGTVTYNADEYYAIFARLTASSTDEMEFGTKLIGAGWSEGTTKSVTIDYVHAGKITATITGTNATEFSLSSSSSSQKTTVVSNNTNSETNSMIIVYFKPSSEGSKSAKLTISSDNDLASIEIDLEGAGQATVNPTFTNELEASYYVEDGPLNLATLWTSDNATGTITYSKVSFKADVENETGATVPSISDNKLSLGQAGTLVIQMHQAASTGYYEKTQKDTIRINKRPNTIKVKGSTSYSSTITVDSYDNGLTLTADNTDYTNCPITNTQTAGKDIATFYQNDKVVYSSYKLGTATWTLSQPENYKYQAGSGSFTVTVAKAAEAADCYVLNYPSEKDFGTYGPTSSYEVNGPADKLYFKAKKNGYNYFVAEYSTDNGSSWHEICAPDLTEDYPTNDYGPFTIPEKNITHIRFGAKFGATLHKWVKDVKITRKTWLNTSVNTLTIDSTATKNPIYPSDGTGTKTLTIDYSLANGGDLHIANDNSKFTLDKTTISNVDCKTGTATINISYESDEAGTDVAHLVIYNKAYRKEVTVTGITVKRDQEVHWEIGDALRVGTQTENAAWVTVGSKVSYSSSNTTLLEVVDGKLVAKAEGEVTITATAPGNDEYNAVEDQKTITITNDLIQSIVWEQNFLRLKLGGANQTLNAYAVSDVEGCTTDRARLITYESSDESVVKVINSNQLQIVGAGQAVLTARQAGGVDADGHKYMAVSAEKAVIVRDPNAPCENYLYIQPQENKWDCGWNHANRQYREFIIDNLDEPSTLYLQYKGEYKTVVFDYFYGTMHVDEWYDGDWHEVPNGNLGTPTISTYQTLNTTLQRKTTKVRIRTNDGVGYHYFKDCKIGQSRYIETPTTLNTFESKVGQVVNQQLTVRYNNITGPVTLSLGSNNSKFSLSQQSIDGDCGDKGTVDVTVSYLPTVEADEQELLTISDGTTTLNVTLHGVATKTSRHIDWNIPETNDVHTVDVVELGAQALTDVGNTTAGNVFYAISSSSPSGVGSVAGNNLTFAKAGTIVVTANTVNDARYNDAVAVSKTYNVALTPTTISTMPVLAEVKSGTAAGEIELNTASAVSGYDVNGFSGTVPGTWSVIEEDLNTVGENRSIKIHFEPSNTDMFIGCDGYINNVTVSQREATEEEVIGVASAITYGQTAAEASTLSNDGTLAGTWEWIDERADDVLAVYTYTDMQARFTPENGNIQPKVVNVSLTVNKANPVVTAQATAITYGQAISASELSTATGDISGSWEWAVDEEQVLSVGDHVLKANFTSTNANYNDLSNVDVTLTVNKIEKLEVPVALSFCAGGEVTFHDNTYTEAGEYQIEAEGATRDTIYNVTVTKLQPTTGTDSKTITVGASESWNGINLSGYAVGSHEEVFHTTNAAGCDSTVTLTLTVVPLSNIFTNAEGDGDWGNANNWESGIVPTSDPDIIVTGALEIKESITVGSLTIEQTGSVSVISGGTLTVKGVSETRAEYGDVHVLNDGAIHLSNSADLQVRDFTLDAKLGDGATSAASGQVSGDSTKLHVNSVAYFQLSFDPSGAIDYGWYDFTVPFPVNISGGIERVNSSADKVMVCGQDFLLMEDDEASFVNGGKGWRQISSGVLMPGKLYTITFDETVNQNTFRFAWNGQGELTNGDSFTAQYLTGSDASRNGWNAIGNAMLRHGYVAGDYKIQAYNHTDNVYEIIYDPKTFAVGTAFFIQVEEAGNIDWKAAEATPGRPIYAPQRVARNIDEFRISLRDEATDAVNDVLFFSASEEATEAYVIGHDLLKKGIPTEAKKAQMWATKRGKNLCDVEGHMMNNKASSDLNFFVPKAGSYELAIDAAPENATLYLTKNGKAIWNLSMSPYELNLEQGTTEGYGLRIVASQQTTTDIENGGLLNDANGVRKVLIDNVIYIVTPEGEMYDLMGKSVNY